MSVVTRIAPSPTGMLHIGTARTALFNYLYAKHHGGKFYLRIEDTDRERSTQASVDAIVDGLHWLGLHWEGDAVYQYGRSARHADVAHELLKTGHAYKCYTSPQELDEFRRNNPNARFRSTWRDNADGPHGAPYVIRIKAPLSGRITIQDQVQGEVTVDVKELDDMVLLRSDGNPTYMLAVVVDDHDMSVTHVIRGADHLTNTFRQLMIYRALGWGEPQFAHIPLIHGPDGAKLSKRHGALGVEAYREMGYLPEALRNYLLRLGWSHGDEEIISDAQAIEWFDLDAVGKSPARFDFMKLENLNAHYIREAEDERLLELILSSPLGRGWREAPGESPHPTPLPPGEGIRQRLLKGMPGLKSRAKTINELAASAAFYIIHPTPDAKAKALLEGNGCTLLQALRPRLEAILEWNQAALEHAARAYANETGQKLGNVAQPLRAALTGSTVSPPVFEVMEILGKDETLGRLKKIC